MAILHISFDFPDTVVSDKTKAVYNLVESQTLQSNIVVSLNRTANPFSDFSTKRELNGYSMKVFGLPFGIGLSLWMYLINKKIGKLLANDWNSISIIHAHKLTFEGIVAYHLSKKYSKPFIITVRGDSDLRILNIKIELLWFYTKILKKTSCLIFLAPWTKKKLSQFYSGYNYDNKSVIIPNIIEVNKTNQLAVFSGKFKFVTVFKLDSYKRKNILKVIKAINLLHLKYPNLELDIIGSGSNKSFEIIKTYISACKFPEKFNMLGKMSHHNVQKAYKNYVGLILPSNPETFGLVFIEALNAGIPIVYAKDSGIDGFFDSCHIGYKVPYSNLKKIKSAIEKIYIDQEIISKEIIKIIDDGKLEIFCKQNVSFKYTNLISFILNTTINENNS